MCHELCSVYVFKEKKIIFGIFMNWGKVVISE